MTQELESSGSSDGTNNFTSNCDLFDKIKHGDIELKKTTEHDRNRDIIAYVQTRPCVSWRSCY